MRAGKALRIGIDARAAAEDLGGRGRVVRELLRALAERDDPHAYRLYARRPWEEAPPDSRFAWRQVPGREPVWQVRAARRAGRECDVLLACNSYVMAALAGVPAVAVVHDVLPLRGGLGRGPVPWAAEAAALAVAARRTARLVAVSHATASALARRHPRTRARIAVVPLGVSPVLVSEGRPAERRRGVLAVGTGPRKNLDRLIAAHAGLDASMRRAHPLLVVGEPNGHEPAADCRMLGAVDDDTLRELYGACAVLCFPSLDEGFGLPVAEAMANGTAVVAAPRGGLPEVARDAAVYVDPESVARMTHALDGLLGDARRRAELGEKGRVRAAALEWRRTAAAMLETVQAAARLP